eukprot:CAMPEP_0170290824 /NCGR_PEP_ID=MMETSP0116_2-20130129/45501_1 /TAXON_ID=400756 /ORGANISM="Durinskia baltica, Strain CSIRO CS-38" /LENGTH=161 /DNA_ID=CAMNT_0010542305 /DNA_START=294 /DNA_END=780 /DNA_ORIENTATION=-
MDVRRCLCGGTQRLRDLPRRGLRMRQGHFRAAPCHVGQHRCPRRPGTAHHRRTLPADAATTPAAGRTIVADIVPTKHGCALALQRRSPGTAARCARLDEDRGAVIGQVNFVALDPCKFLQSALGGRDGGTEAAADLTDFGVVGLGCAIASGCWHVNLLRGK